MRAREDYAMGRTTVEYFETRVEWILKEQLKQGEVTPTNYRQIFKKTEWLE